MLYEMKRKTCDDVVIDKVHLQADDEFYISSKPKKVKLSQSVKKTDACSNEETKRRKSGKSVSKKQKPAEPLNDDFENITTDSAVKPRRQTTKNKSSIAGENTLELHASDSRPARGTDTSEGRTLFIRNLSFDTTEERLAQYFATFGEIEFAKIVKDKSTQHSRGTAFVKFVMRDVVERVLLENSRPENANKFIFAGRPLKLSLAVSRDEATKLQKSRSDGELSAPSDGLGGRNLHLARIGIIRPGTPAAADLTPADLAMREAVLRSKQAKLRNPNVFISPLRLCLRNIPLNVDDKELRQACQRVAGPGAQITECRVMKNVKSGEKNPKSMGFAFIAFEEHKDALKTLQVINNNSAILGGKRKPVVEFSLENSKALDTRRRRAEKSQMASQATKLGGGDGVRGIAKVRKPQSTVLKKRKPKSTGNKRGMRILPKKFGPKVRHRRSGAPAKSTKRAGRTKRDKGKKSR